MAALRHILVTGGTGFIGSGLCGRLLEQGFEVTVLTRDKSRAAGILSPQIQLVEALAELPPGKPVQGVVNLAGAPLADRRWTARRKQQFYASRVGLTERLFEYFGSDEVTPPAVLVSGSAVGYYGPREDEMLNEESAPGDGFASDLCCAWESMACQFENLGTRVCRIRTGIVLGKGGGALKAMLPPFRLGLGGPIGGGEQWMSWIHRDDMIALIEFALTATHLQGAVNATAPAPVRNREFARTLGAVLSRPAVLPMPAFAVRMLFGQMADELLLSGQHVVPQTLLDHNFAFRFTDLETALQDVLNRH